MGEPTKRCPFCAEEIQAAAIKCKHCSSMITAAPPPTAPSLSTNPLKQKPNLVIIYGGGSFLALVVVLGVIAGASKPAKTAANQPPEAEHGMPEFMKAKGSTPAAPGNGILGAAVERSGGETIPPDPGPLSAGKASEVPALEQRLAANPAYQTIWEEEHRPLLTLLLSGVSNLLATADQSKNALISEDTSRLLKKARLSDAVMVLGMIFVRTGRYPADFEDRVRNLLNQVRGLAHHGVWASARQSGGAFDITALAAWISRTKPEYFRELLDARRSGPNPWDQVERPLLPYIATERAALERLALLSPLTEAERSRLEDLKIDRIDAITLWRKYDTNEVAADNELRGKILRVTGTVQSIDKDFVDTTVVRLRSPNDFMPTNARLKESEKTKVAELAKGEKISLTCRCDGRVVGAPVLSECRF